MDKKRKRTLTVNKGARRAFLDFCITLANTAPENYEAFFMEGLRQSVFKTEFVDDSAFSWFGKQIPDLVENVSTLASFVSSGEGFSIITSQAEGFAVSDGCIRGGIGEVGKIEYCKGLFEGRKEVLKGINRNDLVDTFFEILPFFLHQPEEGGPKMIPIRQCPECTQPFLSRRWDQQFCCALHGQRWRSRQKYVKKSEE